MYKYNTKSRLYQSETTDTCVHDVEECAYVSRKIYKIRWKPEGLDEYSTHFVTGAYDDPRMNGLDLWGFSQQTEPELQGNVEFAPTLQHSIRTKSNITEIRFLEDREHLAYCTNDGNVGIAKVSMDGLHGKLEKISERGSNTWCGLGKVSCSSMDVYENTIAVGSADGRICLMPTDVTKPVGTVDGSVPTHSVKFVSKDELVAGSLLGSVSLWDLRSKSESPAHSFPLCRLQRVGVTCLTVFPTERHMLVCGGRSGLISVFDTRNLPIPVRVFNTTDDPISELRFHPTRHSILFSVSNHGTIWQWSNFFQLFDPLRKLNNTTPGFDTHIDQSLLLEYKTVPPEVKCLLKNDKFCTNGIDLNKDRLLCGTDNESIIAIKSLQLK